ncbi:hypothetical protein [Maribacter sp. Hel_I_7]|uniref:hypothetical protein n=1 Tax=Maribacter sp. Hel_I_7 TaxID=1249997 RepID=UPI000479990E|nr:hypothetical protein [Maribacter sp. Hel_I_7]|tara:strand:- start:7320 stop:7688 length:369 start_codon:yes stop_codon:yes gene_type:complete
MKLEVNVKHIADLTELNRAIQDGCPKHYQSPYFILKSGNIISQYEFLTRLDYLNKLGKRKYFDMNIDFACQFKSFTEAVRVAEKFKDNDVNDIEQFYIIGYAESLIVKMHVQKRLNDWEIEK